MAIIGDVDIPDGFGVPLVDLASDLLPTPTMTALDLRYPTPDEVDDIEAELAGRLSDVSLSAEYAPVGAYTKSDTDAGLLDWLNSGTSGYLLHLRTGSTSGAAAAVIGIGTDQGAGNGLLISHKNSGKGILATGQPGSGLVAEITSRGSGSGFWVNVQAGGGAVQINARDGAGFADGVANSTTTFTSATAVFTAGDVGAAIVQLTSRGLDDPFGCIQSGTTIATYVNATTVTLSQASAASGTGVLFNVGARLPALTQSIFRIMDTDLIAPLATFTRGGAELRGASAASIPLTVKGKAAQTGHLMVALNSSDVAVAYVSSVGGLFTTGNSYLTNANNVGGPVQESTTYSSHPAIRLRRSGSTGNNLEAYGGGASILSRINADGYVMTRIASAPADAALANSELAFWIDATPGATKAMFKAKDSGGTVRSGEVALA